MESQEKNFLNLSNVMDEKIERLGKVVVESINNMGRDIEKKNEDLRKEIVDEL